MFYSCRLRLANIIFKARDIHTLNSFFLLQSIYFVATFSAIICIDLYAHLLLGSYYGLWSVTFTVFILVYSSLHFMV